MAVRPVVGIDIGSQQIKVVEMRQTKAGLAVSALGIAPTPYGVLQNNIVTDPPLMGQTIRQLCRESGITAKRVVGAVAGQSAVVVRIIEVPKMSDSELNETMKWEVERHVPFPPNETVKSFQALDPLDPLNDQNPNMEVLLAVAQQDIINNWVDTIDAARMDPVAIDIEPLAIARATMEIAQGKPIVRPRPGAQSADTTYGISGYETVAVVNIGAANTDIAIYQNAQLSFPRSLPLAGDSLTRAIAEMLGYTMEQAERVKRENGVIQLDRMAIYTGTAYGEDPGYDQPQFRDDDLNFDIARDSGRISGRLSGRLSHRISGRRSGEVNPIDNPFDLSMEDPLDPNATTLDLEKPLAPGEIEKTQPILRETLNLAKPGDGEASPFIDSTVTQQPLPDNQDQVDTNLRDLVFEAIAPILGELASELRRSLEYFRSRAQGRSVDRLLLTGGGANLTNIAQFLQNELQVPVFVFDPFEALTLTTQHFDHSYLRTIASSFTVAVGLAAREAVFDANPAPKRSRRSGKATTKTAESTAIPTS